ncbi:MAG: putative small multi-drug export protein [Methanoregulaceae archaeon PtaB.Bin056]|nr:MAG: putative small multi-drug export protein [Methanoregulaceae archaeon PtaB.Bin056]
MDGSSLFRPTEAKTLPLTLVRLFLPVLLAFAYFFGSFLILPPDKSLILGGLMMVYYIPPAGKESIIPLGIGLGIPWWVMVISLALLDVITSLFMILNFGLALRIPVLGPWISRFLSSGDAFMQNHPWLSRWSVLGVAFFVLLPLQGTGGVGATIVGMIAGLSPAKILLAIGIGATAECLVFALGSELIWRLILENLYLGLGVASAVISAGVVLYLVLRRRFSELHQ